MQDSVHPYCAWFSLLRRDRQWNSSSATWGKACRIMGIQWRFWLNTPQNSHAPGIVLGEHASSGPQADPHCMMWRWELHNIHLSAMTAETWKTRSDRAGSHECVLMKFILLLKFYWVQHETSQVYLEADIFCLLFELADEKHSISSGF